MTEAPGSRIRDFSDDRGRVAADLESLGIEELRHEIPIPQKQEIAWVGV